MNTPARPDARILGDVLEEVERDPRLRRHGVSISVEAGIVTLTLHGCVEWASQIDDVEWVVRGVSGVRGVSNRLTVSLTWHPHPHRK
jgi:osmotically-inducible protein OsmY